MATSPSPNSPVTAAAPTSGVLSPPQPPLSSSNSSTTTPAPTLSQPNQTSDPPVPSTPSNSSTPPPQSPPPATPAAPPSSPPLSPPPSTTAPPASSTSPPPTSPPPPSPPASPPPSPPSVPPPAENSPPPPILSPPPPSRGPPPQVSPAPPAATPPSPQAISHSPPPPSDVPSPPSSNSPPPPVAKSPESSSPLTVPPPSTSQPASPPSTNSPPRSTLLSPPPSIPSSSSPSPSPPINSSATETPTVSPLPSFPIEKPIATDSNTNATSTASGINTGGAVAIGIVVGFVVLSFVAMAVWFVQKRKKRVDGSSVMPSPFASSQKSDSSFLRPHSAALVGSSSGTNFMYSPSEASGVGNSRSWFTYEELVMATDGFSAENLLGEGGFGCVYKGCVADGREVAVKQLKIGGGQGEREFRAEVEIISRVHHRHLVSLVGYCISEHQRLLVYDYVPNDTLHFHLHGKDMPVLDWATRFRVAAGAARGIAYLHEDCHPRIIHRDIKSSNILLDKNFEAQVADFGLAKLALDAYTHITTRVMGTFGYMAPEYASSGKLTEKSDVYSFGVVLLELITGRRPVDGSQPLGEESLVEWARPLLTKALDNEDFEGLVDTRLEKNYIDIELFRMVEAAAACVRHSAVKRPRMGQVVRAFDSIGEFSDLSNGMKPGESTIFNSAEHSAQIRMFQRMAFGSQDYSSETFNISQSSWRS